MTTIVCRSVRLAAELSELTGPENTLMYPFSAGVDGEMMMDAWLTDTLRANAIDLVVYEPRFFVDPARYRDISPHTRFVVMASPGEEQQTQKALVCGACAVIDKPLVGRDVRGVLDLVSV